VHIVGRLRNRDSNARASRVPRADSVDAGDCSSRVDASPDSSHLAIKPKLAMLTELPRPSSFLGLVAVEGRVAL
jgi:hypothetical protein